MGGGRDAQLRVQAVSEKPTRDDLGRTEGDQMTAIRWTFIVLCAALGACASAPEPTSQARQELAPTGKLRVGINYGNTLLAGKDASGAPKGVSVDLARELGRRLGVPLEIVPYS